MAAIAFVASLDRLGDEPQRYGTGWDLTARNAYGEVPPDELRKLLASDDDIVGVTGAGVSPMLLDGRVRAPGLAVLSVTAELWPTVVKGTTPRSDGEILVGSDVMDELGGELGDTVELRSQYFSPDLPRQVKIVGTAVFPAVELAGADSTRLASGVAMTWATYQSFQRGVGDGDRLPEFTFFDLADGVDPQVIVDRYRSRLPDLSGFGQTEWLTSLAPTEVIEADRAIGLVWGFVILLGLTVVAAVGHTVVSAVRQRRRDYGVLKALGFTRRQVVGAVTCQSLAVMVLALAAALPLGTALGRWAWRAFAQLIG